MALDESTLRQLDSKGYLVLEAIAHARTPTTSSHANPNAFVCIDGKTYWAKGEAQQGLVSELVCGRLAAKLKAGPLCRVIRVTEEALPPGGQAAHLEGVVVGVEEVSNCVNSKELDPLMQAGQFVPDSIDKRAYSRVICFQTWIGVSDAQALISLTDGLVASIDHGDAFGSVDVSADPTPIVVSIPGVPPETGRETEHTFAAVDEIESLTDLDLLTAVSGIPAGGKWRSPEDRRIKIASWLADRRSKLRSVMEDWLKK